MTKISKFILTVVFGKYATEGFYEENTDSRKNCSYVFSSVFPDEETMNIALDVVNKQ